jgi:hypothetical protein
MEILNARPKGMSFEDYKQHQKDQKNWLKNRLKGKLFWPSRGVMGWEKNEKGKDESYFIVDPAGTLVKN